jgi:acyl carrier protein
MTTYDTLKRLKMVILNFTEKNITPKSILLVDTISNSLRNINPKSKIADDLILNSLEFAALIIEIEGEFDIVIKDENLKNIETIGDLCKIIDNIKGGAVKMDKILKAIVDATVKVLKIDASRVIPRADFRDDLGAESIAIMEIVKEIEISLDINLFNHIENQFRPFNTVQDAYDMIFLEFTSTC